jgi:uncharacterized repeat protein (TIGR04076 family)
LSRKRKDSLSAFYFFERMEPTKEMHDVVIEVKEARRRCPIYKIGDTIYVRRVDSGWAIDTSLSSAKKICFSSLPSLVGEVVKVRHCIQDKIHIQCLDPGPPYTENSVVFEIRRA